MIRRAILLESYLLGRSIGSLLNTAERVAMRVLKAVA